MKDRRGFTFIEMLIVVAMIGILIAITVPNISTSVRRAREAVLKENLYQIRDAINQYYRDKKKYPEDLESLVAARYLREVPVDPMTGKEIWKWIYFDPEDVERYDTDQLQGIMDVKSLSTKKSISGEPYSEW